MIILMIGATTLREHLRDKLLYNLLLFALLLIGSSILLIRLNHGDSNRLIVDLGLSCVNLFGVIIAVFIGVGLVNKEIKSRTVEPLIAKPVHRFEFLLGKYLGLVLTLAMNTVLMLGGLLGVLVMMDVAIEPMLFKAVLLIFIELMLLTAVALLFSTVTTASLSTILTLSMYIIGHLLDDLRPLTIKVESGLRVLLMGMYYALPNLESFNVKGRVIHHQDIGQAEFLLTIAYGLVYTAFLLFAASFIFQRRDFR
jgi:ABC-type transport system involved in multi-copper enzyme maturation permease subunit